MAKNIKMWGPNRSNLILLKKAVRYSAAGLEMVLSVGIGAAIGVYLDRYFGTKPWLTLTFIIFGFITGFIELFRLVKKYEEEKE